MIIYIYNDPIVYCFNIFITQIHNIFLFLYVSKYLQCVYFHLRPFLKVKEYYF